LFLDTKNIRQENPGLYTLFRILRVVYFFRLQIGKQKLSQVDNSVKKKPSHSGGLTPSNEQVKQLNTLFFFHSVLVVFYDLPLPYAAHGPSVAVASPTAPGPDASPDLDLHPPAPPLHGGPLLVPPLSASPLIHPAHSLFSPPLFFVGGAGKVTTDSGCFLLGVSEVPLLLAESFNSMLPHLVASLTMALAASM
jgi:hypothetical protein